MRALTIMASDPWRRETDASTGRAYFWNPTTGEARWTLDDTESIRFDQATRASDPAKGLLHYQNRLKKAVRLVKFPRIEKFRRKIEKYRALAAPPRLPRQPRRISRCNTSRFVGVHWSSSEGKWKANVWVRTAEGRKKTSIGTYDDEEQAALAYNAYVRRHGLDNEINPVDANGKLLPKKKRTSRFWGVTWAAARSKWLVRYKDTSTPAQDCYVGLFADEEAAALAYNEAVIAADLADIREINRVDASGRPLPRD